MLRNLQEQRSHYKIMRSHYKIGIALWLRKVMQWLHRLRVLSGKAPPEQKVDFIVASDVLALHLTIKTVATRAYFVVESCTPRHVCKYKESNSFLIG